MLTLITVFISLSIVALAGWTAATYLTKENSQKLIKEELGNLSEITKMFFVSIKSLVQLLMKASSNSGGFTSSDSNEIDDQLLKFVPHTKEEDKAA